MESIIVFQITPNNHNMNGKYIDWENINYDPNDLSRNLNFQCKINKFNLHKLKQYCDSGFKEKFTGDSVELYCNNVDFDKNNKGLVPCLTFKNIYDDFVENSSEDKEIFNGSVSTIPNAIVLLNENNQYVGHTYCWISKSRVYATDIRHKVEEHFVKNGKTPNDRHFNYILLHLLEGIRLFSSRNGFDTFNIISPSAKTRSILNDKLDFKYRRGNPVGSYIFDPESTNKVLYYPERLNIPFVSTVLYDHIDH